jgi:hypothetical protein
MILTLSPTQATMKVMKTKEATQIPTELQAGKQSLEPEVARRVPATLDDAPRILTSSGDASCTL